MRLNLLTQSMVGKIKKVGNTILPEWTSWVVFLGFTALWLLWFSGYFGF